VRTLGLHMGVISALAVGLLIPPVVPQPFDGRRGPFGALHRVRFFPFFFFWKGRKFFSCHFFVGYFGVFD
jgi:hypothetical protein